MKSELLGILKALKLFDADNTASLTSIAMMVCIAKIAASPTLDWTILTGFFLALANYNSKRWLNRRDVKLTDTVQARVDEIESKVKALKNSQALK